MDTSLISDVICAGLSFDKIAGYVAHMIFYITNLHRIYLTIVVGISTLILALSISFLIQQLDGNIRTDLGSFRYVPPAGLAITLAFFTIPRLNDILVAPNMISHIPAQVGVCLCGAAFMTWTGLMAFQAPLAVWLSQPYFVALIALGVGGAYVLLGLMGCLRAIWPLPGQTASHDTTALRKVHFAARALAAIFAFTISLVILGSILILKSPTTTGTLKYAIILFVFGAILGSLRLGVSDFKKPINLWNNAFQFSVAVAAVFYIKLSTRAFTFHTQLFENFSQMDAAYPRFENVLMMPFIVFGLTSIALAMTHETQAKAEEHKDDELSTA